MTGVPVLSVCSIDPVLRDSAAAVLLCDLPDAVVVRHDITPDGLLHRSVYDVAGTRDSATQLLDHGCMTCALRADLLPLLRALVADGRRPGSIVVALPVGAEPLPLVRALQPEGGRLVPGCRPAAVITALEADALVGDLFGDDLLAERNLALGGDDRRAVGEALAAQVEFSDAILTPAEPGAREETVLRHLNSVAGPTVRLHRADAAALLGVRRTAADPRGNMVRVRPTGAPDDELVWTLHLHSAKPFHPDRLHECIEALGTGAIRGRGVFWLPTRPSTIGVWDGAGGQLSIGTTGRWAPGSRVTRLVVTGIGPERDIVRAAFTRALATDAELSRGLDWWSGREDGFSPWLGVAEGRDEDLSA